MTVVNENPNLPPSPGRAHAKGGGYEISFYPGFVSRLRVIGQDGSNTLLYEQKTPYILPTGQTKPWPSSTLEIAGPGGRVMLQLDDPDQQVDRVVVVMKRRTEGGVQAHQDGEEDGDQVEAENGSVLCPPICPE